jgi:hypothetical protein
MWSVLSQMSTFFSYHFFFWRQTKNKTSKFSKQNDTLAKIERCLDPFSGPNVDHFRQLPLHYTKRPGRSEPKWPGLEKRLRKQAWSGRAEGQAGPA